MYCCPAYLWNPWVFCIFHKPNFFYVIFLTVINLSWNQLVLLFLPMTHFVYLSFSEHSNRNWVWTKNKQIRTKRNMFRILWDSFIGRSFLSVFSKVFFMGLFFFCLETWEILCLVILFLFLNNKNFSS